jgi:hypothetical protein
MRAVKTGSRESKTKDVEDRLRDQIDQLRNQRADARRALFGVLRWVGIQPNNGHDMRAMLEARDDAKEVLQDYLPGSRIDEGV